MGFIVEDGGIALIGCQHPRFLGQDALFPWRVKCLAAICDELAGCALNGGAVCNHAQQCLPKVLVIDTVKEHAMLAADMHVSNGTPRGIL